MKIELGATGNIIQGDVLDVGKAALERSLQDYDSLLYIKWNSTKRRGYGCWELRRRPEMKTVVLRETFEGITYSVVDYKELDVENHVADFPSLNYDILAKLRKMDVWAAAGYDKHNKKKINNFLNEMDYRRKSHKDSQDLKLYEDMMYNMKQQRSALNGLRQAILDGTNPAELARYWK